MVPQATRKPEGGFRFISVVQLCMVWWAYQEGLIRLADLRVWFAAHELVARRCQLIKPGQQPIYTYEELDQLVGRGGRIPASIRRLQASGLLTWEIRTITFPAEPPGRNLSGLEAMLAKVPNHHRHVPVPRRLLRFIAAGCRRAVIAAILGHLFRCLYYHKGECKPQGFCKASWIAEVFGVSLRSVKAARQYLESIGLLISTEIPHWVRNRYGQKMTINLQWAQPALRSPAPPHVSNSASPHESLTSEFAPPDSYKELPTGEEHQKPVCGGSPGFLLTLFAEARELMRQAAALPTLAEPEVVSRSCAPSREEHRSESRQPAVSMKPATLQNITREDLLDTDRLLVLYDQAWRERLIGPSETERLTFVALAQHVIHQRPENAGGLFRQLLTRRLYHYITQEDEDAAQQRLKRYLYRAEWDPPLPQATGELSSVFQSSREAVPVPGSGTLLHRCAPPQ